MTCMNMCIERDFTDMPYVRIMLGGANKIKYSIVQLIHSFFAMCGR
jgi:hypothetical protein